MSRDTCQRCVRLRHCPRYYDKGPESDRFGTFRLPRGAETPVCRRRATNDVANVFPRASNFGRWSETQRHG